jgi:hypothetical protein
MQERNLERRCAIKFCVILNDNATETYEKLKWDYEEHALSRVQVFGWHKAFWMAVRLCTTNLVLEDLVRKKRKKIWPTWTLLRGLTDIWQSQWSVVSWILSTKPFPIFLPRNWACGHLDAALRLRSLSHCHHRERRFNQKGIPVVPKSPYSPDLSPCDFFLFPKIKFHLKGRHVGTAPNIQKVLTDQLRAFPHENFQHCYRE